METLKNFEIAGASVLGTDHLKMGKNNQDFFHWLRTDDYLIAIVSDGCGSENAKYSEVGSKLLSTIFANYLAKYLERHKNARGENLFQNERFWEELGKDVLARIRVIAQEMGEDWWENLRSYFLATLVGVVIRKDATCIFSCGDGFFAVNGELQELSPFDGNCPQYFVYNLTGSDITDELKIQRHHIIPTSEVHSLMIGTDGVGDLIKAAEKPFPAQKRLVGPIEQFWSDDDYFNNLARMQQVLNLANTERKRANWEERNLDISPGLLSDDTTLITLRRKEIEQ